MRIFGIKKNGVRFSWGVEISPGLCLHCPGAEPIRTATDFVLSYWPGCEIEWLAEEQSAFAPTARISCGTPVYTTSNPPPPGPVEQHGKLPSERYLELWCERERVPPGVARGEIGKRMLMFLEVLDEALGRARGRAP